MNWLRWNWFNENALPILLSLMRVCGLWWWLVLMRRFLLPSYTGSILSAAEMTAVLLFSLFLSRWSVQRIRPLNRARAFIAVAGLLIIILLLWDHLYSANYDLFDSGWASAFWDEMLFWENELPPGYPLLLGLIYLWLRGIWDGSSSLSYESAARAFVAGSLSLVFFLFIVNLSQQPPPPQTSAITLIFFAISLVALSLASLKRGRSQEVLRTADSKLNLNRYWVSSSLLVIGILLVLAFILNLIIAPESLYDIVAWVGQGLTDLLIVLIKLVSLILYPILLLFSRILTPLLRRFFTEGFDVSDTGIEGLLQPNEEATQIEPFIQQLPPESRWLFLLIAVIGLGVLFALVLRRLQDSGRGDIEESRESIFSMELLRRQLAQLLPYWFAPDASVPFGALTGEMETRLAIRQLYQKLLALAQSQGWPRAKQQTPLEYGRYLQQQYSQQSDAIETMTNHYLQARYAEDPPTTAHVQATTAAWQHIQPDGTKEDET